MRYYFWANAFKIKIIQKIIKINKKILFNIKNIMKKEF
ncbi:hypothetical protein CAAU_1782 [Caloramator australicus RC3]|uniref:Uncharacterized protein n=1 Tax=Caloramator australicus RC3 TaxID=857293 RepID=I7LH99_9CLOT|nr:hypothetical protein CAAU_1782 [Caloramator australicus RC3]